ncbi:MAG: pitrilysin family protein [Gemmatimonadaceae bacterium]
MKQRISPIFVALALLAPSALTAQGAQLDRTKPPPVGPTPTFHMPSWSTDTLSNGARLVVVERHDLPIVTFSIHFNGGTNQLGTKEGVSQFIGAMMREGTATRSADQLTNQLALLGTNVGFTVGQESGNAGFSSLSRNFDATLSIMMDMMQHSTFPAPALERLRAQALAAYTRGQDVVGVVASQIAPKLLYGDQPYGKVVNADDLRAVTRDNVAELGTEFFQPANATVYVVGDMTRAAAKAELEKAFAAWPASGQKLSISYPAAPAPGPTTIYVVDMPNKPQSQIMLARTIPPEFSPDMPKIEVMDAILGGMFQSRLNSTIREQHGWSYGFNSRTSWLKGPGSERAQGAVTREKTDSSLMEAMTQIRGMTGPIPITDAELTAARNSLTLSLPSALQSNAGTESIVSQIVDNNLPKTWWSSYIDSIRRTTAADVSAMTTEYMNPDHLTILIVGDGAKITAGVKATGIAPVVELDKTGQKLP